MQQAKLHCFSSIRDTNTTSRISCLMYQLLQKTFMLISLAPHSFRIRLGRFFHIICKETFWYWSDVCLLWFSQEHHQLSGIHYYPKLLYGVAFYFFSKQTNSISLVAQSNSSSTTHLPIRSGFSLFCRYFPFYPDWRPLSLFWHLFEGT